jgi:tellurite resistance protein TerB
MGFFDKMKQGFADAKAAAADEIARFKNKDVLKATIAGCTYIAAADGHIDSSEKQKMLGYLQNSPLTKVYGTDEVVRIFNEISGYFDFDFDAGKSEALRIIGSQRSNTSVARMLVRTCVTIGKADGNFDDDEKRAVRDIARELGLDPADFDL